MDQLIDQIIAQLGAAPDATRRAHPLFTAIAAVLAAVPDDHADLERFAARPQRYASVLRDLLAERLPRDAELRQTLEVLLANLSEKSGLAPTTAATGDTITVGDINEATGVAVGEGAQSTVRNIQTDGGNYSEGNQYNLTVFFTAAGIADPSIEQQELITAYLARLAQRCDRLRLSGAVQRERRDAGPALTLSQVYVTLAAEACKPLAEAQSEGEFDRTRAASNPNEVRVKGYVLERPLLLTEALSQRKQLVLLGGPGSGKSSFLRYHAVALAQAEPAKLPSGWGAGQLLPLYASLGAFAAWIQTHSGACDGPGLWYYLLATAQEYGLEGLDQPLTRAFRQGGLLLLLDGLDEVADSALRASVARAVATLAEAGGFVAVTCRVRSFEGAVAEPFAAWGAPVSLAPFDLDQMRHFVQAWYTHSATRDAIDPSEAAQRAAELIDRLEWLPTLYDLGQTPLLLTIITILHYYEGKLPEDRAELYESLVQLLLIRWTQQRREAGAPPALLDQLKADGRLGGLKEYHLRHTLEALAYRAHQQSPASDGRGLLDRHRVRGAFDDLFSEFEIGAGPAAEKAVLVLDYLERESGLLLPEGGDVYGLPHLSYEEYLAGCSLSRQAEFCSLAYGHWQADPSRWREVIFLALGRMVRGEGRETAAGWLSFLLAPAHGEHTRTDDERQRAAFFAYECLREMGGKAALIGVSTVDMPALWNSLASGLAAVVEGGALPATDRVQAGVWLGKLGDPRIPVMRDEWRVTSSPHHSPPSAQIAHHAFLAGYWCPIPSGSFVIGMKPEEIQRLPKDERRYSQDTNNTVPITVTAFDLARYPVTNAQYKLFIDSGGYNPDAPWWDAESRAWLQKDKWSEPRYWNDERFGIARPNHPVVGVSWYEAMAFCRWLTQHLADGHEYRLPSEAEWEYAARGAARRIYPWGDEEPDGERANFERLHEGTSAVGCFLQGATPEGILDLAGTVWERTRSMYQTYPYDPDDGREDGDKLEQKHFTIRGGSWLDSPIFLRAAFRFHFTPGYLNNDLGFRLARRKR
ncbi:MAG: SUMF1/EgtB/PvdO family nonheme iron enzyme [Chloroflexales bacterium]|nr:SUMF1/EgtB/PvdO family nonheme iron enzyme [Chloroflexales bacterium]